MSYRYGLNANDLNWDVVAYLDETCLDCPEAEDEIWNHVETAIARALDNYMSDAYRTAERWIKVLKEQDPYPVSEEIVCENHVIKYTGQDDDGHEFAIYVDGNTNSVDTEGDVPDECFEADYLAERDVDDDAEA